MTSENTAQAWHVANWGLWGWAETILKLIGIAVGVYFLATSLPIEGLNFGLNGQAVSIILLGLLSLLSLAIVAMRLGQKEIIALVFAILNVVGHFSVLIALLATPEQKLYPTIFAVAYALGEITKQVFLTQSGYTESGRNQEQMLQIPRSLMVVYFLIAIFVWF